MYKRYGLGFCLLLVACESYSRISAVADSAAFEVVPMAGKPESQAPVPMQQKLIRTGRLTLEVDRLSQVLEQLSSLTGEMQGLVADTRVTSNDEGEQFAEVSVRVPADRFEETFRRLKQLGRVEQEATDAQDVTKNFHDLTTRLAVKEEAVARLRRILAERTGDLQAVLAVERELERAVTELEQLKGEKRYLDQQIAYSTISLTLLEPGVSIRSVRPPPILEAVRSALSALSASLGVMVFIVIFAVPWLVLLGLVWWGVRAMRRRYLRSAAEAGVS